MGVTDPSDAVLGCELELTFRGSDDEDDDVWSSCAGRELTTDWRISALAKLVVGRRVERRFGSDWLSSVDTELFCDAR